MTQLSTASSNEEEQMMGATHEGGNFAGKVAFVTGTASGIGRAAALAFAREGAQVAAADVSDQNNQETARMIDELGEKAMAVRCDVTRSEDVKSALDTTVEAFGHLDVAFNNTGAEQEKKAAADITEGSGTGSSPSISAACSCA